MSTLEIKNVVVRFGGVLALDGPSFSVQDQIVLGKLGHDLEVDAGRAAARLAALSALATLRAELESLDRVAQVVSVRGVVNDGASEVFLQVFGERGQHARLAVGVSSLPANLALEIELLVEVSG